VRVATHRPVSEFLAGIGTFFRGFGLWASSPRVMLLGAVPALIVGVFFAGVVVLLVAFLPELASALTPFADAWTDPWRSLARVAVGTAVLLLAVVVLVAAYTAVTLTVGDPFYERISRAVERRLGDAPEERDEPTWTSIRRAVADGLRLFASSALVGVLVFAVGFVPVVGAIIAFVIAALLGGWLLAVELTGYAFDARGIPLAGRRRTLHEHRARSIGFGMVAYLLFLVPVAAVVVMPTAVSGATLLSREVLGWGSREQAGADAAPPAAGPSVER
jgi:CysZ protein